MNLVKYSFFLFQLSLLQLFIIKLIAETKSDNQKPLPLEDLLQRADTIFPKAKTTSITIPHKPEDAFIVGKKQAGESISWGSTTIALGQFSDEVVQLEVGMNPSRAKAILNQLTPFTTVHWLVSTHAFSISLWV
ncbi:MAG TPA: hypothetical protein V6C71_18740 [Coleofasciculaceae cyanobacterium]